MLNPKLGRKLGQTKFTNRDGSLNEYLKEISEIKQFSSPDEEYQCAVKAKNGDDKAKDELIKRNLRFVISVAKQYESQKTTLSELINEGNIGLIQAANKFDPTMGFKFISYAIWDIRASIIAYIKDKSKIIRIPSNKQNELIRLNKAKSKMEQELFREINSSELVSDEYGDTDKLMQIAAIDVVSMNKTIGGTDDLMLEELLYDKEYEQTDNMTSYDMQNNFLNEILSCVSERDKEILEYSFGLNGKSELPLNVIGDKLGLSGEGVRQAKIKSLLKLKTKLSKAGISQEIFEF